VEHTKLRSCRSVDICESWQAVGGSYLDYRLNNKSYTVRVLLDHPKVNQYRELIHISNIYNSSCVRVFGHRAFSRSPQDSHLTKIFTSGSKVSGPVITTWNIRSHVYQPWPYSVGVAFCALRLGSKKPEACRSPRLGRLLFVNHVSHSLWKSLGQSGRTQFRTDWPIGNTSRKSGSTAPDSTLWIFHSW